MDPNSNALSIALLYPSAAAAPGESEDAYLDNERMLIAERRAQAARMYCGHRTMREIAAELKVSLGTIHSDLQAVLNGIRQHVKQHATELLCQEILKLNEFESDVTREWERSKGEYVETTQGKRNDGTPRKVFGMAQTKRKQRSGDAKLAALILKCREMRFKLLGLLNVEDILKKGDTMPPVKFVAGLDPVEAV